MKWLVAAVLLVFLVSFLPFVGYAQISDGESDKSAVVVEGRVLATVPRLRADQGRGMMRDVIVFLETDEGNIEPAWYKAGE